MVWYRVCYELPYNQTVERFECDYSVLPTQLVTVVSINQGMIDMDQHDFSL